MTARVLMRLPIGAPKPTAEVRHERLSETLLFLVFSLDRLWSIAAASEPVCAPSPLVPDMSELLDTERSGLPC
jgi:hypothetical protein